MVSESDKVENLECALAVQMGWLLISLPKWEAAEFLS